MGRFSNQLIIINQLGHVMNVFCNQRQNEQKITDNTSCSCRLLQEDKLLYSNEVDHPPERDSNGHYHQRYTNRH